MVTWTETQAARLKELDANNEDLELIFFDEAHRNRDFQKIETHLVALAKERLQRYREDHRRPAWCQLENALTDRLVDDGFRASPNQAVQVSPKPQKITPQTVRAPAVANRSRCR